MSSPNITKSLIGLQNWIANQIKESPILEKQLGDLSKVLSKQGAPGPPPRQGLQWKPQTHRWIRPKELVGDVGRDTVDEIDNLIEDLELDPNTYFDPYDVAQMGTRLYAGPPVGVRNRGSISTLQGLMGEEDSGWGSNVREMAEKISSRHFSDILRNTGDFPKTKKGTYKYFPKHQIRPAMKSATENVTKKLEPGMGVGQIQKLMIADMLGLDESSINTDPRFETPIDWEGVDKWRVDTKFGGVVDYLGSNFRSQLQNQSKKLATKASQIGTKPEKKEQPVFKPNPSIVPGQPNKYTTDVEEADRVFELYSDGGYGWEFQIGDKSYDLETDLRFNTRYGKQNAKEIGEYLGLDSKETEDQIQNIRLLHHPRSAGR